MKKGLLIITMLCLCIRVCGQRHIASNVYRGDQAGILYEGANVPMKYMKLELVKLASGKTIKVNTKSMEHVIISKSGSPYLSSKQLNHTLTPGSVAVMTKGNKYKILNLNQHAEDWYYVFSYIAKDPSKGSDTATSFVRLWEDLSFRPHDRGGVRSYFDRPSSQTNRLEMHVTTLRAGLKSHDPHTHKAEEIILMIDGQSKMLIGETYFEGKRGDAYYVESAFLHGIQNTGDKACSYFAFQWD